MAHRLIVAIAALLVLVCLIACTERGGNSLGEGQPPAEQSTAERGCVDSDGGRNYSVAGTCMGFVGSDGLGTGDICLYDTGRAGILREVFCNETSECETENYSCPEGEICRAGKCVAGKPADPLCVDTDGGLDPEVKGEVHFMLDDACYISNYPDRLEGTQAMGCSKDEPAMAGKYCGVDEYYCKDPDHYGEEFIECPDRCEDGACIS
jgi:hypothetical protein